MILIYVIFILFLIDIFKYCKFFYNKYIDIKIYFKEYNT